jgi:hypothetical protein
MPNGPSSSVSSLPEGYTLEQPSAAQPQQQQNGGLPPGYTLEQPGQASTQSTPGEIKNDVGNTVIVPKDGESYLDTIKRAVAHSNSMTAEQHQAAFDKETATMPGKAATVLAAAPVMGFGGAAALSAAGGVPAASGEGELVDVAGNAIRSADPVVTRAIAHLKSLLTIKNAAQALFGTGEAAWGIDKVHALYKELASDSK